MADVKKVKVKGPNGKTITVPVSVARGLVNSPTKEYSTPDKSALEQDKK